MPEIGIGIGIEVWVAIPISIQRARTNPAQGMIRNCSAGLRRVPAVNPTYPAHSNKCQQPLVYYFTIIFH